MKQPASALYLGQVMHQRMRPLRHRLQYRVFSLLFDLDELAALDARLRLFSIDRFNLFSLRLTDHGCGDPEGPRAHVQRQLDAAGLGPAGAIRLLTMPRILGYVFNPLSVYYCHRPDGRLLAVLYEVNSTFGERHSYLLPADPPDAGGLYTQRCDKRMHVSPFLPMQMHYLFRLRVPGEQLHLGVTVHGPEGATLHASLRGQRRALSDSALLAAFFGHPLLTLKVISAIHWEALRLWLKGARIQPRPAPAQQPVSLPLPSKTTQP